MAAKKKELTPTPSSSMHDRLLQRLEKNGAITSASASMTKWRYVDFYNPTGKLPCITLEWLFGARGLLAGRVAQLRAAFSKGKSSYMYLTYAAAQALFDAFCFHIETEGALSPADYIASFGCDPAKLLVSELSSLEDCLETVDQLVCDIRGGFGGGVTPEGRPQKTKFDDPVDPGNLNPIVIGIDSMSSLGIRSSVDLDVVDADHTAQISYHTKKIREYFRNRVGRFRDTQTLMLMSSHETAKIETGFKKSFGGPQKTALAQEAIGIIATYGIDLNLTPYIDKDLGVRKGDLISFETFKNKISPRGRQAKLYLEWNKGFDLIKTDVEFLMGPNSPFKGDEVRRHSHGISCKLLGDKTFKSDEEFLRAFHDNQDMVQSWREAARIRGFGFDFEAKYAIDPAKLDDEKAESAVTEEPA